MIALDTNILARAIATEVDAGSATKAQQVRAQNLLSSGQDMYVPITPVREIGTIDPLSAEELTKIAAGNHGSDRQEWVYCVEKLPIALAPIPCESAARTTIALSNPNRIDEKAHGRAEKRGDRRPPTSKKQRRR